MPLYQYRCKQPKCKHEFESLMRMADPDPPCPKCKTEKVEKVMSSPSLKFQGTGFYVTDYPK